MRARTLAQSCIQASKSGTATGRGTTSSREKVEMALTRKHLQHVYRPVKESRAVCIFLSCVCFTFSFALPLPASTTGLYVFTLLHFGGVELSHYGLSPIPVMHVEIYNANTPHDFQVLIERMHGSNSCVID
jgi:hypothetical protein